MEPLSFEEAWEYARSTFSEGAELAGGKRCDVMHGTVVKRPDELHHEPRQSR